MVLKLFQVKASISRKTMTKTTGVDAADDAIGFTTK